MENADKASRVPAELVMRLRERTGLSVLACKRFLEDMTVKERAEWRQIVESQSGPVFHDPQEDDPRIRPLFEAICKEVALIVNKEHTQRIAALEASFPAIADVLRSGRGLCHRHWWLIKQLMKERHGIDWRSPADLNPGTRFD